MWWNQFITLFLGDLTTVTLVAGFVMSLLGLYVRWYFKTKYSVKYNPKTPEKFNLKYWLKNNLTEKLSSMLFTVIVIFVSLRFPVEWFGIAFSMAYAFAVGLCLDWFIGFLFNKIGKKPVEIPKDKPVEG